MTRLSVGVRLTLWFLAIFALGQFAFGAGMWLVLRHHLVSLVDDNLEDQAEDLRNFLDAQKPSADLAKFREEVAETYSQEHAGDYLAIVTASGDVVYISGSLKEEGSIVRRTGNEGSVPFRPVFEDRLIRGKALRFLRSTIESHGFRFMIQMGTPTTEVWDTLNAFRTYLFWLAPLVLLISAAGGYWLSHRALAPVDALTRTARNISGHNLSSRLEKLDTGDELQRLSDTLNEMLDRIEKAFLQVTQFTADASHELRTPISLMRTEAELALRRARDAPAYREALQHILQETERTSALIEDLLELARADSGRQLLTLQPLDLGAMLRQVASEWGPMAASRGHQLVLRPLPIEAAWVGADEMALRRVFVILLDNAVKYTIPPGRIEVALYENGGRAVVTVSDNGIGIPADEQKKIFERFYRVDKARSRAQGGAGLGLAIARWIVEGHGGSIEVDGVERKGTSFSVSLPLGAGLRPTESSLIN